MEFRWGRSNRKLRKDAQTIMIEEEELSMDYIRYAVAVERNLRILEAGLHTSDDAVDCVSSILWGFSARDCKEILDRFVE